MVDDIIDRDLVSKHKRSMVGDQLLRRLDTQTVYRNRKQTAFGREQMMGRLFDDSRNEFINNPSTHDTNRRELPKPNFHDGQRVEKQAQCDRTWKWLSGD